MLFENCYTEGLPTVPCRRAMHTGRYTLQAKGWPALDMDDTTIADLCWGRPIDTALIFDCPMYRLPKFGYSRGFDKVYFVRGEVDKVRDFALAGYYKYSWALYNDDWSSIHWPRSEEKTYAGSMYGIAGEGMAKSSAYLVKAGRGSLMDSAGDIAAEAGDAVKEQAEKKAEQVEGRDTNALDGEDQWTCGHNSKAEVPERDELYDRRTDPYQLHNVADKYPDVALKMLTTLKGFMADLRTR